MRMDMTVGDLLYKNAEKMPDKEAIVYYDKRINYREIDEISNQFANVLVGLGIKKGDKVSIMMKNSDVFPAVYFGIVKTGAVAVAINIGLLKREVQFIVDNADANLFIFDDIFVPVLQGIEEELPKVEHFICVGENIPPKVLNYSELMKKSSRERPPVIVSEDDICSIIYTSGTTGTPRGAVFTHHSVLYTACMTGIMSNRLHLFSRTLHMMPLFHSAPLHVFFLSTVFVGGTNVIIDTFDPELFLQTIQQEKITNFFGPGVVYLTCAKLFDISKYDITSIERFVLGGSPISKEDKNLIIDAFGIRGQKKMQEIYGLTEAGPTGIALYPEEFETHTDTIGRIPGVGTELILVDKDGKKVGKGEAGEIAVRSQSNMLGYYNDPVKTETTLVDGWVRTGDVAQYDDQEYIHFKDRLKDMIISGGQNVYPREIEDVLMSHPAILEAAAIGVPHAEWGESVKAIVVLKPNGNATSEELEEYCRKNLARFKVPREVDIVETLPRNAAGKVLKRELRKIYCVANR